MRFLSISLALVLAMGAHAQESKHDALLKEFAKVYEAFEKRLEATPDRATKATIYREESPYASFGVRFLELAKSNPKDPAAYPSLVWIAEHSEVTPACEKTYLQAIDLLAEHHAQHKDNEKLFERMIESPFPATAKFLRAVFEKHPDEGTRGRAGFTLGMHLKTFCATADNLRDNPETAKRLEIFVGPELYKRIAIDDTAPLLAQADEAFARVRKDYALVPHLKTVLVKLAEVELFELRNLAIGKVVPDLDGDDLDGKKFKLSDYRGKVTVVVFWGTWCGHCTALIPQERKLVKQYDGQPFALVGVNNDDALEKVKPFREKHQITWPSLWDRTDKVSARWNIQGWPAIFVMDAKGVIRYKNVRGEKLDNAVATLMKEVK